MQELEMQELDLKHGKDKKKYLFKLDITLKSPDFHVKKVHPSPGGQHRRQMMKTFEEILHEQEKSTELLLAMLKSKMKTQDDMLICCECKLIHHIANREGENCENCPRCKSQSYRVAIFPDDYRIVNMKTGNVLTIGD